jgi:hypothetical protein
VTCPPLIYPDSNLTSGSIFGGQVTSLMAKQRVPILEIKNYLGHESLEITQKYLHILGYSYY